MCGDACDVTGAVHGHHIGACTAEDPTSIGQGSGCQRAHPSRAERQPAQPARTACAEGARSMRAYGTIRRGGLQGHYRKASSPSRGPWHGMHAVTSEFMRSTHAPQVLTTTSLIVGRLLDAAGLRTSCSTRRINGLQREQQAAAQRVRVTRPRHEHDARLAVLCSWRLGALLVWVSGGPWRLSACNGHS